MELNRQGSQKNKSKKSVMYGKYEEAEEIIKRKMREYNLTRHELICQNCSNCKIDNLTRNKKKKYFCNYHEEYIDTVIAEWIPCISFSK